MTEQQKKPAAKKPGPTKRTTCPKCGAAVTEPTQAVKSRQYLFDEPREAVRMVRDLASSSYVWSPAPDVRVVHVCGPAKARKGEGEALTK